MSMTPEEASEFICPVLPRIRNKLEGFAECMTETQQRCIGQACMWWVTDQISDPEGECVVRAMYWWLDAINDNVSQKP